MRKVKQSKDSPLPLPTSDIVKKKILTGPSINSSVI